MNRQLFNCVPLAPGEEDKWLFSGDRNKLDLFEISHIMNRYLLTYLAYKTLVLSKEGKGCISMWREPKKNYLNDELFPRKNKIENQSKITGYQSQVVTQT